MLQIVIWMLCVYLLLKGPELRLTAQASTHETRDSLIKSAGVWEIVAYIAAIVFFGLSILQGNSVPSFPQSQF